MKKNFVSKALSVLTAAALTTGLCQVPAGQAKAAETKGFQAEAAITSLTADMGKMQNTPIGTAVNKAFANVFGTAGKVTVTENGSKSVMVTSNEMKIDLSSMGMGIIPANVTEVKGAAVNETRKASSGAEVPSKLTIPLADSNGTYNLTVKVDYMNTLDIAATLKLDMSKVTEKETLEAKRAEAKAEIAKIEALKKENYTEESWNKAQNMLKALKGAVESGETVEALEQVITGCKMGIPSILKPAGADFTKLAEALNEAPSDEELVKLYTEATADAVKVKKDAAQKLYNDGADAAQQEIVDSAAEELKAAVAALVYKGADYSKAEEAKAKIPADLSKYTDDSVKALNNALAAVKEGLDITHQSEVDTWAANIETAVKNLKAKDSGNTSNTNNNSGTTDNGNSGNNQNVSDGEQNAASEKLDKNNLKDGV